MEKDASVEVSRDEMTNLFFTMGHFHHYRYLRAQILEKDVDTVYQTFATLKHEQQESIAGMLRVELVVNAVMYCSDLASILLAFDKPDTEIIKTISSLHETGSGSVKEFYQKIPSQGVDYFWKLLKYDKLGNNNSKERYERSCKRFQNDMTQLSKFFLKWYELFSCYKHGLNVITLIDSRTGKDLLMMGKLDGTFDIAFFSPSWYLGYAEVMEIGHKIFDKVIEPSIWNRLRDILNIDLKERSLKATVTSKEPEDKTRPYKSTINISFPWKIWKAEESEPFY